MAWIRIDYENNSITDISEQGRFTKILSSDELENYINNKILEGYVYFASARNEKIGGLSKNKHAKLFLTKNDFEKDIVSIYDYKNINTDWLKDRIKEVYDDDLKAFENDPRHSFTTYMIRKHLKGGRISKAYKNHYYLFFSYVEHDLG